MSDLEDCIKSSMVSVLFEGAKRFVSEQIQKKEPITPEILLQLRNKYLRADGTMHLGHQCNISFCLLAYAGFFHYLEVSRIRRHHLEYMDTYVSVFVPSSKADVYHEGKYTIVAKTATDLCPDLSLYLSNACIPDDAECYVFHFLVQWMSISCVGQILL